MTVAEYVREGFGDYAIPDEVLGIEGIEDLSWHNDVCASFGRIWNLGMEQQVQVRIYVEHPDLDRREYPERERFSVTVFTTDCDKATGALVEAAVRPLADDSGQGYDGSVVLAWTDDVDTVVRLFVLAVLTINEVMRANPELDPL